MASDVEIIWRCDPSLRDEIVSILSPHSDGCQDTECRWCDDAIARADAIATAVAEHLARSFDELAEQARTADRNNRDVDAALAWDTASRLIRRHGSER
jgi:hypothetical protein